jgi:Uma2 family endonuclease
VSFIVTKTVTADELLALPDDGNRYELVKGELIQMSPTGHEHGIVALHIAAALHDFIKAHNLGASYAAETGFLIAQNPDTVRAPDAAYVRKDRLEAAGPIKSFWVGAPDLVVEVVSPGDTVREVEEKVAEWLAAGTLMVWIISPRLRTVTSYRSLTEIVTFTEKDTLEADDVLPGFRIDVRELFEL